MAKIKEIAVTLLLPVIKEIGKAELLEVLAKIEASKGREVYEKVLQSVKSNFELFAEVAKETKTKIDDGLVDFVLEAVEEAAEQDGIALD